MFIFNEDKQEDLLKLLEERSTVSQEDDESEQTEEVSE